MPTPRHRAEIEENLQEPFRALAIAFLPRAHARLTQLAADFVQGTAADLRLALHNLAGTTGSYGLRSLHAVLVAVEQDLSACGEDLSPELRTDSRRRVLALAQELADEDSSA